MLSLLVTGTTDFDLDVEDAEESSLMKAAGNASGEQASGYSAFSIRTPLGDRLWSPTGDVMADASRWTEAEAESDIVVVKPAAQQGESHECTNAEVSRALGDVMADASRWTEAEAESDITNAVCSEPGETDIGIRHGDEEKGGDDETCWINQSHMINDVEIVPVSILSVSNTTAPTTPPPYPASDSPTVSLRTRATAETECVSSASPAGSIKSHFRGLGTVMAPQTPEISQCSEATQHLTEAASGIVFDGWTDVPASPLAHELAAAVPCPAMSPPPPRLVQLENSAAIVTMTKEHRRKTRGGPPACSVTYPSQAPLASSSVQDFRRSFRKEARGFAPLSLEQIKVAMGKAMVAKMIEKAAPLSTVLVKIKAGRERAHLVYSRHSSYAYSKSQ